MTFNDCRILVKIIAVSIIIVIDCMNLCKKLDKYSVYNTYIAICKILIHLLIHSPNNLALLMMLKNQKDDKNLRFANAIRR